MPNKCTAQTVLDDCERRERSEDCCCEDARATHRAIDERMSLIDPMPETMMIHLACACPDAQPDRRGGVGGRGKRSKLAYLRRRVLFGLAHPT